MRGSRRRSRWGNWELKRRIARQGAGRGIGGRKGGGREWEQSREKGGDGEIGGGGGGGEGRGEEEGAGEDGEIGGGGEWREEKEGAGGDGEMHRTALQREVLL